MLGMPSAGGRRENETADSAVAVGLEVRQFKPTHEALGILVNYLSATPPFENFRVRDFIRALKHQIAKGHHVCAFRNEKLVGYCGWLCTTSEAGEKWMNGGEDLKPVPDEEADAAALTIVRADEADVLQPMIRALRKIGKGKRIFFRRDYEADGQAQKRRTVLNV